MTDDITTSNCKVDASKTAFDAKATTAVADRKYKLVLNEPCQYTRSRLQAAISKYDDWELVEDPLTADLQWEYDEEKIVWDRVFKGEIVANSYHIRKGLIRKAQLAMYLNKYAAKPRGAELKKHLPTTVILDITSPDELGWCLADANDAMDAAGPDKIWILKPSVTNGADGIKLIRNWKELRKAILAAPEMHQWVLQEYIDRPMLVEERKFHMRVYVVAVGSLEVYVFNQVLALFALDKYNAKDTRNMLSHITNTCLQTSHAEFDESKAVRLLSELDGAADGNLNVAAIMEQIKHIMAQTFLAYKGEFAGFFPMTNCFELFGVDFLVDASGRVFLVEVNSGPDLKQSGGRVGGVIQDLLSDLWRVVTNKLIYKKEHNTNDPASENNDNDSGIPRGKLELVLADDYASAGWGTSGMKMM